MYNHSEIDKKWQNRWEAAGVFKAVDDSEKPKKYLLVEFPFPSGAGLHVGHPRSYVALDVLARKYRMQGFNVLYPMGWDAFGLPTENYAIKTGRPPSEVTAENVATFKGQIQSLGLSFDWSREINSTDPGYYKWTQWQFLQFFKAGLAYKAKTVINWCPKCKIGLANEEAQGGVCERCDGPVEKREKEQWMIGITKYADRLISDLDTVDYLPRIRKQQEEWIGKSEGAEINFALGGIADHEDGSIKIQVFTTRPDTIFGATFIAVSAGFVKTWIDAGWKTTGEVRQFVDEVLEDEKKRESTREEASEKKGIATGLWAINPVNGEKIPVWIANYVLSGVGTGAIMAVPAHDERDWEFAKKYGLPIKNVVAEQFAARVNEATPRNAVRGICIRDGKLLLEQDKIMGEYILPGGGIEPNENPEEALLREIREETGYLHAKISKSLGVTENNYYHPNKKLSFQSTDFGYVFELSDEETEERSEDEVRKIDVCWIPVAEALEKIKMSPTFKHGGLFVERAINGHDALYCGEGIATNSEFLNGLTTLEAKQKMIAWLEEHKIGSSKTTYKLRDWVFSRQRYWGEPIPLVHCDSCAKKKQKVLFIHAFASSFSKNQMMRAQLEAQGFEVVMPTMSTNDAPEFEKWMEELAPYFEQLSEDDIVMGHSLGGHAAVHALARAGKKIKALLLMAPAIGEYEAGYWDARIQKHPEDATAIRKLANFLSHPADVAAVSSLADSKEVVWSSDDDRVPEPTHEIYPSGWYINRLSGMGHLRGDAGARLFIDTIAKYKNTGWIPVQEANLPLTLPAVEKYEPTDNGESPLATIPAFVNTTCPRCGGAARRETDTMPNWAGSSWYFLRYIDAHNDTSFAAADKLKYWMPVDLYNGGMEHTTLHLLYSRFWNKFMYDCGFVPTSEPYARRVSHGLIMAEDGTKMSKSKGNVVNPDEIVQSQGSDTLRMYEMFIGPFSEPAPWSTSGVSGVKRFLDRVAKLREKIGATESDAVTRGLHKMLKAVTEDYERMSFNTAVAHYMTFVNVVYSEGVITEDSLKMFLRALNVAAPHVCEELWEQLGGEGLLCTQSWPQFSHSLTIDESFELVVQINGKVRDRILAQASATDEDLKSLALSSPKTKEWLEGKDPQKVIVIKGKLVNIVV